MINNSDTFPDINNWLSNNKINQVAKPSKNELQERAEVLAWSFIKILRDWNKIDIADYRRFEPDIDLMCLLKN
mgnify:FL=1